MQINTPIEYNSFILNDTPRLYHLTSVEGFDDPELRETIEDKSAAHGQNDYGQFLGGRLITLNGTILAESSSQRDIAEQALLNAFIKDGIYHWLKWQVTGEIAKQLYCKVFTRRIKDDYRDDPFFRDFIINLRAIDPRIYSQEELIKIVSILSVEGGRIYPKTYPKTYGIIQTGGSITCTNNGNFSVLPIVKMYGPLLNPKIRNNADEQKEILVNMTVSAGDYLEIDFEEKTIMLNGYTSRYNYLASSPDQWWKIKPGNNPIEFRDSGKDVSAYAVIIFRHGWI